MLDDRREQIIEIVKREFIGPDYVNKPKFLQENGEKVGIIVVFSDLSEIMELRDAVKSMEKIQAMNAQLEIRNRLLNEAFGRFL